MSVVLFAALALLGKEIILQPTNVVDVTATGCMTEAVLYVNGFRLAVALPSADGCVVFPSVRLQRGVTDIRVESGADSDQLSWRFGETEREDPGERPIWRMNPKDEWFRAARFGLFIHWGLYSIPARGEWWYARGDLKSDEYRGLMKSFNPTDYDPSLWARLAKAAGMKYVVFTTRHHDGFCMFDSHFTDYKITNTPYGKDVLRMLVEAFRAEGLKIGFYHSLPDWTHDGYVDLESPSGIKTGKCGSYDPARHTAYRELLRNHVNQLTTEYGKVDMMFFDYLSKYKAEEDYFDRKTLMDICRRNQPDILINDRLSYFKDGESPDFDYYTPEIAVPNHPPLVRGTLRLWETCATMNDHWGYFAGDENFKSATTIVAGLVGCVSRGGNLLLNVGPDDRGRIPNGSARSLKDLAEWYSANGESITDCGPSEYRPPFGCAYTQRGRALYLHVLVPPMGDLILEGLRGKVASATLLRTRATVPQTDFWGFETLRPDDLRLHPQGLLAGDVIRLDLKQGQESVGPLVVQDKPGYNCWPMIRTLGDKLVCAYSVGVRHSIGDGEFGVYARTSSDGGRHWSPEVEILNDPMVGEQTEGSGHDASGAMLLWVRNCGDHAHHDLYRTTDGIRYEKISAPKLDPLPTQVMDVVRVPGVGLVSLWFYCSYGGNNKGNSWGMLVSTDEGRTWSQRTIESGLPLSDAATEPSFVVLPDGRLFGIARGERSKCQFQIVSRDSGRTWTRTRTNITDVNASTPSLIYDPKTDLVANYYYERGKGFLKRRVARVSEVFDSPLSWPDSEILAQGSKIPPDAGNANAVRFGETDYVAYYSGVSPNTAVLLMPSCVPQSGVAVEGEAEVRLVDAVVTVTSTGAVSFVRIPFPQKLPPETLVLNDAWERSYGDLEWKDLSEKRVSPWYCLASVSNRTWGVGVETGPGAMCCWEVTTNGTTLVLDLRAGGRPVRLDGRTLRACRIVRAESREGESAWNFGRRFCKMMCPKPKLPKSPVYGYNDWYCAYGKNTATNFLADAAYIMACAKGCANPPYVVMDDGWQRNSPPVVRESGRGPWDAAGPNFGMDMPTFCREISALGAKPGLWYRPLRAWEGLPESQRLKANGKYLDPTVPEVKARIVEDLRRFRDWGFKLVKIDFLSYDLAEFWPCDPHPHDDRYIQDDREWRDSSRTTAEVVRDLYQAMKDAVGDDVVIIGCNAFNHLAAGIFELQRTGCDTSGKDWNWTKNHGVNTLAMRSIQDGAFFKIDADCVGLAEEGAVPWALNRQWMDLLGRSGTPFFVSWRRQLAGPEVRKTLSEAFRRASSGQPTVEPCDWFATRTPGRWRQAADCLTYDWGGGNPSESK